MDETQRLNVKRCVQVIMPCLPAPVLDYALSQGSALVFGTEPTKGMMDKGKLRSSGSISKKKKFALRRLDSGNFGEISLTSPVSNRHLRNDPFMKPAGDMTFRTSSLIHAQNKK
ncbi:hypothetical protein CEUSTIGMA_g5784.t1 [Chlamydomonas eustigma]|uniref:Uncharacterized protein n=1 Tax=Chlamydomonas eustigma TaxID=1157962 RepID=A0A250X616_9CHLO|nr:hypothetical protein CEUSTIGMA_g5784.t1 [Chlamydomonas eustigma]|eukprot:GAX78342.1 hypothetical protein CEUSTIGMA_g5784.t1 [Chlamydomonas eustigma]